MKKPDKILYVDDEAMALKYFERLVSPITPVITASSVEEGKAILRERGAEIAVLLSDQRMPGARGNELLGYAREYHPAVVRMLTTAYSELGEAIEAINTGEIYRYIAKPWELDSLRADLKNALELAELRSERDGLLGDKLLVQQQQLVASRLAGLYMLSAGAVPGDVSRAVYCFARTAQNLGCAAPPIDWHQWGHAELGQAEARRGAAIARGLADWQRRFGTERSPQAAIAALASAMGGTLNGGTARLTDGKALMALLDGAPGEAPTEAQCAWLAWLLWWGQEVEVRHRTQGVEVHCAIVPGVPLGDNWLALLIEDFSLSDL